MQGQIVKDSRCKRNHAIRRKLHIFANRLLLRRDIQQSQCRSNHRIKIDSMLCPDVRIHKYLNKHGIQPFRQQSSLMELRYSHTGQRWQYDGKPSKDDKNDLHMDSPLCLQRLARSHQRNELQYHAFLSPHIEPTTEMGICHARILLHALHLLQKKPITLHFTNRY